MIVCVTCEEALPSMRFCDIEVLGSGNHCSMCEWCCDDALGVPDGLSPATRWEMKLKKITECTAKECPQNTLTCIHCLQEKPETPEYFGPDELRDTYESFDREEEQKCLECQEGSQIREAERCYYGESVVSSASRLVEASLPILFPPPLVANHLRCDSSLCKVAHQMIETQERGAPHVHRMMAASHTEDPSTDLARHTGTAGLSTHGEACERARDEVVRSVEANRKRARWDKAAKMLKFFVPVTLEE